jgi:hypothetical protein
MMGNKKSDRKFYKEIKKEDCNMKETRRKAQLLLHSIHSAVIA